MKENLKYRLLGIITAAIALGVSVALICVIANAAILSGGLLFICAMVLAILVAVILLLAWDSRRKVRSIIAIVLAVILIAVEILGIRYVSVGHSTLEQITEPQIDYAEVGVFVRKDDTAKTLGDVADYKFGILDVQDRVITDLALEELKEVYSKEVVCDEFSGIENLMDALLKDKKTDCIVINKSMLELLEET